MRFRPTALIAIGMFVSAAAVGVLGSEETPVFQGPSHPQAVWPSGPVSSILGINEAISFPEARERNHSLDSEVLTRHLSEMADLAKSTGAQWTRGHTVAFPRLSFDRFVEEGESWERVDLWVAEAQRVGLSLVGMIGPWPGNRTERFTPRYELGAKQEAYLAFVRAAVERYDGDGVADMPGLTDPIMVWEIDNEPDLKNAPLSGRRARSGFATPSDFARVVVDTSRAIREANPNTVVLQGGIGRPTQSHGYEYMTALFKQPGMLDAIDAISIHVYHRGPDVGRVESAIRRAHGVAPGKAVWLTETSVPSEGRHYWMSEAWQAEMLFRAFITSLRLGVERVFWHTLLDPPPAIQASRRSGTKTNSLFKRSGDGEILEKPATKAYRILSELFEGLDWADVQGFPVQGGRGVALGARGYLVYGETNNVIVEDLNFSEAVDLLSDEPVQIEPRARERLFIETNERTVWLKP